MTTLEICIDDVLGLETCMHNNVARIELCSALMVGGLTPSAGFITCATSAHKGVHVLVRPRPGDFYFSEQEVALMCNDISHAVDAGAHGVVIGAATQNNQLNLPVLRRLSNAAGTSHRTLHRVIDTVDKPLDAMEQAIDLGFSTILSSGTVPRAVDGMCVLEKLQNQARNRIEIMAGGGLEPRAISLINQRTGIRSFHSSCSLTRPVDQQTKMLGFSDAHHRYTDAGLIRAYQLVMQKL